jgi:hypothetical protein
MLASDTGNHTSAGPQLQLDPKNRPASNANRSSSRAIHAAQSSSTNIDRHTIESQHHEVLLEYQKLETNDR